MRYPAWPRWIGGCAHTLPAMTFSRRDRATIEALADVLLPESGPLPSARAVGAGATVERYVRAMDPAQASRLTLLVRAFSVLPLVSGHGRRFRHLSLPRRERSVARLAAGGGYRKQLYGALKQFVVTAWASSPDVSAAMGFDGGCLADDPDHAGFIRDVLPAEGGAA